MLVSVSNFGLIQSVIFCSGSAFVSSWMLYNE